MQQLEQPKSIYEQAKESYLKSLEIIKELKQEKEVEKCQIIK